MTLDAMTICVGGGVFGVVPQQACARAAMSAERAATVSLGRRIKAPLTKRKTIRPKIVQRPTNLLTLTAPSSRPVAPQWPTRRHRIGGWREGRLRRP